MCQLTSSCDYQMAPEAREGVKYFYQIGFIEQTKVIRFAECYQEFNQVPIFLSREIKPDR